MRRLLIHFLAFAAVCLLGASAAFAQSEPRSTYWVQRATLFESLPASQDDIVMLGNSITDGGEWSELLGDAHVKNRGISGDTTDGVLERLGTITRGRPAKVFLLIGINDFSKGVPPEEVVGNIEKIVRRIKEESPGTLVYVQSILPLNDEIKMFPGHKAHISEIPGANAGILSVCEKTGAGYIDLYSVFVGEDGRMDPKYTNDGLHLLGTGYLLWASLLRPLL